MACMAFNRGWRPDGDLQQVTIIRGEKGMKNGVVGKDVLKALGAGRVGGGNRLGLEAEFAQGAVMAGVTRLTRRRTPRPLVR